MNVNYFRARRDGPEAALEEVVASRIPTLFPAGNKPSWIAGSLPLGAGMPDLAALSYEPEVVALANATPVEVHLIAYLRSAGRAQAETIASRTGNTERSIRKHLGDLQIAGVVLEANSVFSVAPLWRRILPTIVTVEVKVAHWQRAVNQAGRNTIFAHRSFVALPSPLASRIKREAIFGTLGVGLISVEATDATTIRPATRRQPRVWLYYYRLASVVARCVRRRADAIHCPD